MALHGLKTVQVVCSILLLDNLEILIIILNGNIHLMFANKQISGISREKMELLTTLLHLVLACHSSCISLCFVFPVYAEDIPLHAS